MSEILKNLKKRGSKEVFVSEKIGYGITGNCNCGGGGGSTGNCSNCNCTHCR